MKKSPAKKMVLSRETLQRLHESTLNKAVAGGVVSGHYWCYETATGGLAGCPC